MGKPVVTMIAAFAAATVLILAVQAGEEETVRGRWIEDQNGCRHWSPAPKPGLSVTWTGACDGGNAAGTGIEKWSLGGKVIETYTGQKQAGKLNGHGTYVWAEGDRYTGGFRNGNFDGRGTYAYAYGDLYVGQYRNDVEDGQGSFLWKSGDQYAGGFVNGERHGTGVFTWANQDFFVGEYRRGKRWSGTEHHVDGTLHEVRDGKYTDTGKPAN